jgi:glycosyltransferase 2 family protein
MSLPPPAKSLLTPPGAVGHSASPMQSATPVSDRGGSILRVAGLVIGLGLFGYTLRDLDAGHLTDVLRSLGPLCLLILVPQAVGMAFHTAAWKELLAALRTRAPFFALGEIFASSEAVRMALPAGPAIAESVAAYSLKSRFQATWARALASLAAKKAWVLCTHAACLLLLLAVAQGELGLLASRVPGGWALGWFTIGMTVVLAVTGAFTLALLASRRAGRAATILLSKLPITKVKRWADAQTAAPEAQAAAAIPLKSHLLAGLYMLGQWVSELIETWLVLRLLGVELTLPQLLVVELGGSLVRSLAFVVPGGLGVQDASYVALLVGLGVPGAEAAAPAFVLLKRAKDIVFVVLGLALFATDRKKRTAAAASASADSASSENAAPGALAGSQT